MGLLNFFARKKALSVSPSVIGASNDGQLNLYQRLGGVNQQVNAAWLQAQSASYAYIYQTQPAVRMVVDFIARNLSQVSLKLYHEVSQTERDLDETHPAALTMGHPNEFTTSKQFIWNLVADYLVHDNAYILKFRQTDANGRPMMDAPLRLTLLPPPAVVLVGTGRFTVEGYRVYRWDGSTFPPIGEPPIPPENMIHWHGYNPADPRLGVSKLQTLRDVLAEEAASQTANVELLKAGLSKPGYIKRPVESPDWSEEARVRFQESWANQSTGFPKHTPVLEEGMEFADFGITPRDAQMLEGRDFTIKEVARSYGVPLGVLGLSVGQRIDLAEERRQVYSDLLPPLTTELEALLNLSILEQEYNDPDFAFYFDLNEKLRGAPEVRYPAMTAAAGRPWKTVNEVRADEGLPAIDGGDELTIPLNVALGDLPAPNVMPPQNPLGPPQDGSHRDPSTPPPEPSKAVRWANPDAVEKAFQTNGKPKRYADMERQRGYINEAQAELERYFARQARSSQSKDAKAADSERWNSEAAAVIHRLVSGIVAREGGIYSAHLAGPDFDIGQLDHYLSAMATGIAEKMNAATARDAAETTTADAFARAHQERAPIMAASIGTRATMAARREAAKQAPGTQYRMQTWIADTERHGDLDGQSVPLTSDWGGIEPGSEPNCACSASIS